MFSMESQRYGYNEPGLPTSQQSPGVSQLAGQEQATDNSSLRALDSQAPPVTSFASQPQNDSGNSQSATPLVADDADLIENEWVEAAKRIIESSKGDPYSQTKEMTMLRADYMKKRYNKDIKVPES
jgi:hypothetical protein